MKEQFDAAMRLTNHLSEAWGEAIQALLVEAWRVGYETAKEEVEAWRVGYETVKEEVSSES